MNLSNYFSIDGFDNPSLSNSSSVFTEITASVSLVCVYVKVASSKADTQAHQDQHWKHHFFLATIRCRNQGSQNNPGNMRFNELYFTDWMVEYIRIQQC